MNLFAHQQQVVTEKDRPERLKFGNWRGTGSGKTRTTVAIAEGVTLVVCPKTQADEKMWEIEWFFQKKNSTLFVLSKEQFKKKVAEDPSCLSICGGQFPDTFIIDEAHTVAGIQPSERQKDYIKFPRTSQIFDAVIKYITIAKPKRIHPLTATPAPNPMAVFSLGIILGRKWDYHKFRETFYIEKEVRKRKLWLVNRSKRNRELMKKTLESIGYTGTLYDWFDVPKQTFMPPEFVGVSLEQQKLYEELQILYPDPLVQTGKRQMLEQGIFQEYEFTPEGKRIEKIRYVNEFKTEAIDKYMQQFGRVVVFCRYTEQIEMYKKKLGDKYKVLVLQGATKNRKAVLDEAKASEECLFIAQMQISAGWELPDFPCLIFASMNYSFVDYDQAIGRLLRASNIKKNLYIFLCTGDGDEQVLKTIHAKEEFVSEAAFIRKYGKKLCANKKLRSPQESTNGFPSWYKPLPLGK